MYVQRYFITSEKFGMQLSRYWLQSVEQYERTHQHLHLLAFSGIIKNRLNELVESFVVFDQMRQQSRIIDVFYSYFNG